MELINIKKEIATINEELKIKKADSSLLANLATNEEKLAKATAFYEQIKPAIANFDNLGADSIAAIASENGWLKIAAVSKLKDAVRNANDFLVLEAKAPENKEAKAEYTIAKDKTEGYKVPLKLYLEGAIDLDSTMVLVNSIYPIQEKKYK